MGRAVHSSIRRAGGQLVAKGRIPTPQALLAAIGAGEQTDEEGA